jgi:hypothetical protein
MSISGSLKVDQLTLGRVKVDWMKQQGLQVEVLAGLVDTKTGKTRAWVDGTGIIWSEKTGRALEALRQAIEEDMAKEHLTGSGETLSESRGVKIPSTGLAEHLGTSDEPPSV